MWWYALEDLIIQYDEINLSEDRSFICKTKQQKEQAFLDIREIILSLGKNNFSNDLDSLFACYEIDRYQKTKELAISWAQIIELASDDLCTIAGHTKNHHAFNQLQEGEIIDEIIGANQLIKVKINKVVRHFSYPFGNKNEVGQSEFNIIKNLGFETTTRQGSIYYKHKKHLECLSRIMLTENFDIKSIGSVRINKVVTV